MALDLVMGTIVQPLTSAVIKPLMHSVSAKLDIPLALYTWLIAADAV